jgi:hypothetical protein
MNALPSLWRVFKLARITADCIEAGGLGSNPRRVNFSFFF